MTFAAGLICGCAGHTTSARGKQGTAATTVEPSLGDTAIQGAVIPRPTPELVRLSLWVDAGSRDSKIPQIATVAGWIAAQRNALQTLVGPDGTEFWLYCNLTERSLKRCVEQLRGVLDRSTAPDQAELSLQLGSLAEARRRRAQAPASATELRSLQALLGPEAAGFIPLGSAVQDPGLTSAAIAQFWIDHYGPRRSLVVAAGDLKTADLAPLLDEDPQHRRARKSRAARSVNPGRETLLDVHTSRRHEPGWISIATWTTDPTVNAALVDLFEVARDGIQVRSLSLRGGHLVQIRQKTGRHAAARLQRSLVDMERVAIETRNARTSRVGDSLAQRSRYAGHRWMTDEAPRAARTGLSGMGIAVSLTTRNKRSKAAIEKQLLDAVKHASESMKSAMEGTVSRERVMVTLANGTRIRGERQDNDQQFAAAIALAPGSAADTRVQHGRAALLATVAATSCGAWNRSALQAHLGDASLSLVPMVGAESWGLLVTGPSHAWQTGLDTMLRCAVRPRLESLVVSDARAHLVAALRSQPELAVVNEAARTLRPDAPGQIAPWGTVRTVPGIRDRSLRSHLQQSLVGSHIRVFFAGPANAEEVAQFVERRLAQLPPGKAPEKPPSRERQIRHMHGETRQVPAIRVLVGLEEEANSSPDIGAAVANLLADQFRGQPGIQVLDSAGGGYQPGGGWSLLRLSVTADALPQLPTTLSRAMKNTGQTMDGPLKQLLSSQSLARRAEQAGPAGRVLQWWRAPSSGKSEPRPPRLEAAQRLLNSRPRILIQHPLPR